MAFVDVVIIGSGFGGAVMSARIGAFLQANLPNAQVAVLEKGDDATGRFDPDSSGPPLNSEGNRFRHTMDPSYLARLGEVFTDPMGAYRPGVASMNVVAGRTLGGGSMLYDGVSLRAPTTVFDQQRDGRRVWPRLFSRAQLSPYYDRVEQTLRVKQMAWTDEQAPHWQLATKRDFVFAEGCRRTGATAVPLKLATHDDRNEGWWNQGQRFSGRQDLSQNYLEVARVSGVSFRTGHTVEDFSPIPGGYLVRGTDRRGGDNKVFELECRILILAAGAVASTGLMLKSQDNFQHERALDQSEERTGTLVLGQRLSANGDYGVSGIVGADYEHAVDGFKGKPMSSFCPSYWNEHQFIIIPFYAPPLHLTLGQFSHLIPAKHPAAEGRGSTGRAEDGDRAVPDWGVAYKEKLKSFGPRMLTMGCLALDAGEGQVSLQGPDGRPTVRWSTTHEQTERRWNTAVRTMRGIYEALGGEMYLDSYRYQGTVNTSHPLGGCPMTEDDAPTDGIVNTAGESVSNRNLFVVDGSVIPSALGVNPSLTIAAVAESMVDRLIRGDGTESLLDRLR